MPGKWCLQNDTQLLDCNLLCAAQVVSAVNGPALLLQLNLVEAAKKAANPTLQFIPSEFSAFGAVGASLQLPDMLCLTFRTLSGELPFCSIPHTEHSSS